MERFNQDEMAPIHQAIMAITDPYQQAAALTKACNVAQQADALISSGGSIEPHTQADALTKAVISAVQSLAKREKGSPLSDAEMKQRQEAARSRRKRFEEEPVSAKTIGVAAGTGVALGAAVGASSRRTQSDVNEARHRRAGEVLHSGDNRTQHGRILARHDALKAGNAAGRMTRIKAGAKGAAIVGGAAGGLMLLGELARRRGVHMGDDQTLQHIYAENPNGSRRRAEKTTKADLRKAVEALPLAKRAVAVALYNEGHHDDLRKFLGPALMAARAALPSVARSAASAGSRMFGAASGAASRAGAGAMSAGRAGMRGIASAGKKAWGATRSRGFGAVAGAAMLAPDAIDAAKTGAKAAGSWAKKNKRTIGMAAGGLAGGAGVGAAYGAGVNALAERRSNQPR